MINRPAILYYGGKWKIADWIISHFPKHRLYLEPFGGGASVLLRKPISEDEIYNDLDDEIVNFFTVLRDKKSCKELIRLLEFTPYSKVEWERCHEYTKDIVEQARRTYVLFFMSVNKAKALRRQSNGFKSSVRHRYHQLPKSWKCSIENLKQVSTRLNNVIIEKRPALDLINKFDVPDGLIYLDPPYLNRRNSKDRYNHEMNEPEQHLKLINRIVRCKGYVILSGYENEIYQTLVEDYGWIVKSKESVIGTSKKGECKAKECIWLNPKCAKAQAQISMF